MSDLGWIYRPADRRIAAAWGEFDNLSGAGKPLVLPRHTDLRAQEAYYQKLCVKFRAGK